MKVASFVKATVFVCAAALVASAGVANAQLSSKEDIKCRGTLQKTTGKAMATASKAVVGCWKNVLKGKAPSNTNCNDPNTADTKGKIAKATTKISDGVTKACTGIATGTALAEYVDCPSPGTQGPGLASFAQVGSCLQEVSVEMAGNAHRYAMNPGSAEVDAIIALGKANKDIVKCAGTIEKVFNKLLATVDKTIGKEQQNCDKKGAAGAPCGGADNYTWTQTNSDPKGKIGKAITKLNDGIDKACTPLADNDLALLRTCGNDLTSLKSCLTEAAVQSAGGVTQTAFNMPGTCPTAVIVTAKPRQGADGNGVATTLDAGWTGFGHNSEIIDFTGAVNLSCADGTCSSCTVTTNCSQGNCRCSNDVSIQCDEPFVADADDCGGAVCNVLFGAPLPLSASNTPTCITTQILEELTGTVDVGTGATDTIVKSASKVHTGIGQTNPCPQCVAGVCDTDSSRSGLACTVDGTSPDFPDTSTDCPPKLATNVTGTGLKITLPFSDSPAAMSASLPCSLVPALDCPCQQCSGDTTIGCNSDADCAAVAAGTCSVNTGAGNVPNACMDGVCTVDADGRGECLAGPVQGYCDGFTHTSGEGILTCANNGDCAAIAGAGSCTISENRRCFGDPITVGGTFGGQEGAVLGGNFCSAPTNSASINGAAGTPGPVRIRIAWDFDGLCPDGITPYRLGGANCP
jgi:hypothetical protein